MKYAGDIPVEHLELVRQLEDLEDWFKQHGDTVPSVAASKGYVCISHDYYIMDMEEEGERFLKTAEMFSPGYFKGPIHEQMKKDPEFNRLVKQLHGTMAVDLLESLGFEYK